MLFLLDFLFWPIFFKIFDRFSFLTIWVRCFRIYEIANSFLQRSCKKFVLIDLIDKLNMTKKPAHALWTTRQIEINICLCAYVLLLDLLLEFSEVSLTIFICLTEKNCDSCCVQSISSKVGNLEKSKIIAELFLGYRCSQPCLYITVELLTTTFLQKHLLVDLQELAWTLLQSGWSKPFSDVSKSLKFSHMSSKHTKCWSFSFNDMATYWQPALDPNCRCDVTFRIWCTYCLIACN